jgi:hypothetical protein
VRPIPIPDSVVGGVGIFNKNISPCD